IKRGIIENRAMDGLKGILEHTKANLSARAFNHADSSTPVIEGRSWIKRKARLLSFIFGIAVLAGISSFVALATLRNHNFKGVVGGRVQ
ncbi:MAG TPA: hypothetical protein VJS64_18880, partial [Pyrinomonadaceae bacterium]|nr:hypothetical protein [Pyrinomonadaceae bacterium]